MSADRGPVWQAPLATRFLILWTLPMAMLAGEARAQGGVCTDETKRPSFELTDANRLTPEQFKARIVGRTFTYRRIQSDRPNDMRFTQTYREDGSLVSICENRPRRVLEFAIGGRARA